MEYRVVHKTKYIYSQPVNLCHNEVRLIPRNLPYQTVTARQVRVEPNPSTFRERDDFFGNRVCYFSIQQPHKELTVIVTSQIRVLEKESLVNDLDKSLSWENAQSRFAAPADTDIIEAYEFSFI